MNDTAQPTVFLSYSWTTPEYAERVEALAHDLTSDGVHVILDQWDLREGQDKHAFMERCVLDPAVTRVLILIDPRYVERANRREGGVGTETLIISGEVYARVTEEKFIPVVMDRASSGEIELPVYLRDRIYIDLSDPERREEQYERLIRNLYGKPEKARPPLGRRPAYLDDEGVRLSTGQALPMFKQALMQDRPNQAGHLDEYLGRLASALEVEKIAVPNSIDEFEAQVSASIDHFRPYRDEFIQLLELLGRYGAKADLYDRLHAFFERLVNFRLQHEQQQWNAEIETENLAFLSWELFLYSVGLLLRANRLDGIARLLQPYFARSRHSESGALRTFTVLDPSFQLIERVRQQRLGTRWTSAAAQLLRERVPETIPFEALAEADSLLWVRSMLNRTERGDWFPRTTVYREYQGIASLPVWIRARGDDAYFARLAPVLGVNDRAEANVRIAELSEQPYFHMGFVSLGKRTLEHLFAQDGSS